jgi:hypothetical protein
MRRIAFGIGVARPPSHFVTLATLALGTKGAPALS